MPSNLKTFAKQSKNPLNCLFPPDKTSAESLVLAKSKGKMTEMAHAPAKPPDRIDANKNLYLCC
jgi:hypothetical protein